MPFNPLLEPWKGKTAGIPKPTKRQPLDEGSSQSLMEINWKLVIGCVCGFWLWYYAFLK